MSEEEKAEGRAVSQVTVEASQPIRQAKGRRGRSILVNFLGILCSRVFGLGRDVLMTWYWGGTGAAQAAFHVAFAIPNMLRMLFGEGAFTAAFVPALTKKLENSDRDEAWLFAERVISLQLLVLLLVCIAMAIVAPLIGLFIPADARPHIPLIFRILPLLMPYSMLICLAGCFGSILNSLRKFALPSFNPVLFNIVQIGTILVLSRIWRNDDPRSLYCFCASVLVAGVVQMVSLMYGCRRVGFHFHFSLNWKDGDVRDVVKKFVPGVVGAGAHQLNQLVDQFMVTCLGAWAVSSIQYSRHLVYLPVGLFGVAISTVCLTDMSSAAGRKDMSALSSCLTFSLRTVQFLCLPCMVLLFVFAEPAVKLLYFRGAFTAEAVEHCVYALRFYLLGMPAFCMVKVAATPHNSLGDTKTPAVISLYCIAVNFVMNIALIFSLRQGGLALATSISSWVNVVLLLFLVKRPLPDWKAFPSVVSGLVFLAESIVAATFAWAVYSLVDFSAWLSGTLLYIAQLSLGGGMGLLIYLALGGTAYYLQRRK